MYGLTLFEDSFDKKFVEPVRARLKSLCTVEVCCVPCSGIHKFHSAELEQIGIVLNTSQHHNLEVSNTSALHL